MMTLRRFSEPPSGIPPATSWYLADLGQALGKQELFTKQAPQKLKVLREHALIESAVSSNRIEGVEVEPARVGTIVFGKKHLRDRDEEEVRGYRKTRPIDPTRARRSCRSPKRPFASCIRSSCGGSGDAGEYKEFEERTSSRRCHPDGRRGCRFRTVRAANVPVFMAELIDRWHDILTQRTVHPLIALAAFNLDFLCIHPFRDGNGRASRLLLLLGWYHLGNDIGRYISLERLIEQSKERYYETLQMSSHGWHQGKHDPWPYVNYVLYTLLDAGKQFEGRVGETASPRGEKRAVVIAAIERASGSFSVSDLQRECPGVSMDTIRHILKELRDKGQTKCLGRGRTALWNRTFG